jgi:hypothetical protein
LQRWQRRWPVNHCTDSLSNYNLKIKQLKEYSCVRTVYILQEKVCTGRKNIHYMYCIHLLKMTHIKWLDKQNQLNELRHSINSTCPACRSWTKHVDKNLAQKIHEIYKICGKYECGPTQHISMEISTSSIHKRKWAKYIRKLWNKFENLWNKCENYGKNNFST